ncbi:NAD(P)H-binding protein [Nocardia sp. NPDC004568]|uniref:NAD(P)-dependent oxidoreductase n=1 Tax=Nocardia sp. NPDC004568 TaxID=3154551 RepID=UPI0033BD5906
MISHLAAPPDPTAPPRDTRLIAVLRFAIRLLAGLFAGFLLGVLVLESSLRTADAVTYTLVRSVELDRLDLLASLTLLPALCLAAALAVTAYRAGRAWISFAAAATLLAVVALISIGINLPVNAQQAWLGRPRDPGRLVRRARPLAGRPCGPHHRGDHRVRHPAAPAAPAPPHSLNRLQPPEEEIMRIVIFGANGPTGRLLTGQALESGHDIVAFTRRPGEFPIAHDRLTTIGGDVYDPAAVARAVSGADAVLSTLGVPFSRKPITTYSAGVATIVAAMNRHGVHRIAVVSSRRVSPNPGQWS